MTYPPQQPGSHGGGPDQTGGWGGWGQGQGQQQGQQQPYGGGYPGTAGFPRQGYEGTGQFDGHNQGQPGPSFPSPRTRATRPPVSPAAGHPRRTPR
ncbi:hypothetical protein ACOBQX_30540 [Actinokineospora sp. G85]|uniref:hypothetical protein n=1 Tax=Actinokineospora sp. G85 TaxID=3406626 RepID=UPI003C719C7B